MGELGGGKEMDLSIYLSIYHNHEERNSCICGYGCLSAKDVLLSWVSIVAHLVILYEIIGFEMKVFFVGQLGPSVTRSVTRREEETNERMYQ